MKSNKKKLLTMIAAFIAIALIIITSTVAINHLPVVQNARLEKLDAEYLVMDQEVREDVKKAEELPAKYQEKVQDINKDIIDYFKNVHGLDVTDRLSKLIVKQVMFFDESIAGYYDNITFDHNVYVSKMLTQDNYNDDMFEQTYIHETVHYLGCCNKNAITYTYLYEGLTEYITENIANYSGRFYIETPGYEDAKEQAEKMVELYPELEKEIISAQGEFDLNTVTDADSIERQLKLKAA